MIFSWAHCSKTFTKLKLEIVTFWLDEVIEFGKDANFCLEFTYFLRLSLPQQPGNPIEHLYTYISYNKQGDPGS